ncbi:MAG: 50S ribosomal protein L4 [Candidatus Methylomirabilaceae bacterium]
MQPTVRVVDVSNTAVEEIPLDETVFGASADPHLLHAVVTMQLANRRQGTASTRTRSEVRGGGRKPWKQKGTGRARAGTRRSPLWRGGGTVFGPKPRSYAYLAPRRVRAAALRGALSSKVQGGRLIVLGDLVLDRASTRGFKDLLARLGVAGRALVVMDRVQRDGAVARSCRNLRDVTLLPAEGLNVYDLLKHDTLIMTRRALSLVQEAWKP